MRAARDVESPQERARADERIEAQVKELEAWKRASLVLTYLAFGSEVETRGLIRAAWECGVPVAIPRCNVGDHTLAWVRIDSFDGLVAGVGGIEEPAGDAGALDPATFGERALTLVPGLVFDERCQRVGYGGGYYDRFLATFPGVSVGLCRRGQLVSSLEALGFVEPHDVPVDLVVSDRMHPHPRFPTS